MTLLTVERDVFGRWVWRNERPRERISRCGGCPSVSSCCPETSDGVIACDRNEPRPEGGVAAKAVESDIGLHERILNRVLGISVRSHDGAGGTVRRAIVPDRELVER